MLGDASLRNGISIAIIRHYLANTAPYFLIFILIICINASSISFFTDCLSYFRCFPSCFADHAFYIKSLLTYKLIKDFVRAWFAFLNLSNHGVVCLLRTEELNRWLNIIFLSDYFSIFCLLLKGTFSLNDVSLSNHELTLSTIWDKSFTYTVQAHFPENSCLSLSLLVQIEVSIFKSRFKGIKDPLFFVT